MGSDIPNKQTTDHRIMHTLFWDTVSFGSDLTTHFAEWSIATSPASRRNPVQGEDACFFRRSSAQTGQWQSLSRQLLHRRATHVNGARFGGQYGHRLRQWVRRFLFSLCCCCCFFRFLCRLLHQSLYPLLPSPTFLQEADYPGCAPTTLTASVKNVNLVLGEKLWF